MKAMPERLAYCCHCAIFGHAKLSRTVCANGAHLIYWICVRCGQRPQKNGQNISHQELRRLGIAPEDIPCEKVNAEQQCEVRGCTRPGSEVHHWAPRSVFEDAEDWPMSLLRPFHHRMWHDRTRVAVGRVEVKAL